MEKKLFCPLPLLVLASLSGVVYSQNKPGAGDDPSKPVLPDFLQAVCARYEMDLHCGSSGQSATQLIFAGPPAGSNLVLGVRICDDRSAAENLVRTADRAVAMVPIAGAGKGAGREALHRPVPDGAGGFRPGKAPNDDTLPGDAAFLRSFTMPSDPKRKMGGRLHFSRGAVVVHLNSRSLSEAQLREIGTQIDAICQTHTAAEVDKLMGDIFRDIPYTRVHRSNPISLPKPPTNKVDPEQRAKRFRELVRQLEEPGVVGRGTIVQKMMELRAPESRLLMESLAKDESEHPLIRSHALETLVDISPEFALALAHRLVTKIPPVREPLGAEADMLSSLRTTAIRSIAKLKSRKEAVKFLQGLMPRIESEAENIRVEVPEKLESLQSGLREIERRARRLKELKEQLEKAGTSLKERRQIAYKLAGLRVPGSHRLLESLAQDESEDIMIRAQALEPLVNDSPEVALAVAHQLLEEVGAVGELSEAFNTSYVVRRRAVETIVNLEVGSDLLKFLDGLIAEMESAPPIDLRAYVGDAIAKHLTVEEIESAPKPIDIELLECLKRFRARVTGKENPYAHKDRIRKYMSRKWLDRLRKK